MSTWITARNIVIALALSLILIVCVVGGTLYLWARQEGLNPLKAIQLRISLALHDDELNTPVDANDHAYYPFEITGADASALNIGNKLKAEGLIKNADLFVDYVQYHQLDTQLQIGTYYLQKAQTIPEIAHALADASTSVITFSTLPGMRLEEVALLAASETRLGISEGQFRAEFGPGATIPPEFKAWAGIPDTLYNGQPPSLEGFLYPAIYAFRPGITVSEIRNQMITAFQQQVFEAYEAYKARTPLDQQLSLYQVVILASIIERETVMSDENPKIASVYLNRLAANMKLDADPTVQYAIGFRDGRWWPRITPDDLQGLNGPQPNHHYNTYMKTDGSPIESLLPPGPIASPGLAAIDAVLNPAQTPYLYFQACEGDQYHTFSTTYEDHAVACP